MSQTDKTELQSTLRTLSSKVEDLSTCNDLIAKHGTALQRSLSELETLRLPAESTEKIKQVNERATLFRITSNAMINVSLLPGARGGQPCSSPPCRTDRALPAGLPGLSDAGPDPQQEVAEVAAARAGPAHPPGGDAGAAGQTAQPPGEGFPRCHRAACRHCWVWWLCQRYPECPRLVLGLAVLFWSEALWGRRGGEAKSSVFCIMQCCQPIPEPDIAVHKQ